MNYFKIMFHDAKSMAILFLCFMLGSLTAKYYILHKQNAELINKYNITVDKYDSLRTNCEKNIIAKDSIINNYAFIISEQTHLLNTIIKEKN